MNRYLSVGLACLLGASCLPTPLFARSAPQQSQWGGLRQPATHRQLMAPRPGDLSLMDLTNLTLQGPCGSRVWPWTAQYSPDGNHLYVSQLGGFVGSGACAIVKLDAQTLQQQATIPTGEGPEEVAFTSGPNPLGFVTCSAESSVTIFDENALAVAQVPIPVRVGSVYGTAFPYGLAVAPDGLTVWVGTGEGRIFAINVATRSLDASRTIDLGADRGFGRIAFQGARLVLTATRYHPNWQGSSASLISLLPQSPSTAWEVPLGTSNTAALYPSPQDLAIAPSGLIYVAGFDMGPQVFVIDPLTQSVVQAWSTMTQSIDGKFQALGLHGNWLMVADTWSNELARFDIRSGRLLGVEDTSVHGLAPNELTFSPDGSTLVMPLAGSDRLVRFQVH